ncbi:MAG: hypothetical protein HYV96_00915 [Opitutae bacterium]|nr:hypothetical protein [Opitutae bacterium]
MKTRIRFLLAALFSLAPLCAVAVVQQTLTGTAGTSFTFAWDGATLSLSGEAHDYNSADYSADGSSWSSFSAVPQSVPFSAAKAYIRISRNGGTLASSSMDNPANAQKYKVTVSLFNSHDYPVSYKLMQGTTVLGQVTLSAHEGLIQSFITDNPDPITVFEQVSGISYDGGQWIAVEGAVHESAVKTATPTLVPNDTTPVNETIVPEDVNLPDDISPTPAPESQPVWKPRPSGPSPTWTPSTPNTDPGNQTDLLTNATYRQGIENIMTGQAALVQGSEYREGTDKIVSALNGTALTPPAELAALDVVDLNQKTVASKLLSKLPTAPTVETPGTVTQFSATVKVPGIQDEYALAFDLADYPAVSVFRALVLAALSLSFFFLTLKAVKEAFA